MSDDQKSFLPLRGNYRNLIAFQKSECIFDTRTHQLPKKQSDDLTTDRYAVFPSPFPFYY